MLCTISSDITINGKREGIILVAHSLSPFFIYSIAISGLQKSTINANNDTAVSINASRSDFLSVFVFSIDISDLVIYNIYIGFGVLI